jgi:hypothetical protein
LAHDLVKAGIKCFLNFVPKRLSLPSHVYGESVDFARELENSLTIFTNNFLMLTASRAMLYIVIYITVILSLCNNSHKQEVTMKNYLPALQELQAQNVKRSTDQLFQAFSH